MTNLHDLLLYYQCQFNVYALKNLFVMYIKFLMYNDVVLLNVRVISGENGVFYTCFIFVSGFGIKNDNSTVLVSNLLELHRTCTI